MDYYLLAFMLIVLIGSVLVFVYYLKEKKEQLEHIKKGVCPQCKKLGIELSDQRLGGCSTPTLLSFTCQECNYTNSFSVENRDLC